jgi:hypothetical protein
VNKSANLAGLAKDAVKQKFAKNLEKRLSQAKISDTRLLMMH